MLKYLHLLNIIFQLKYFRIIDIDRNGPGIVVIAQKTSFHK